MPVDADAAAAQEVRRSETVSRILSAVAVRALRRDAASAVTIIPLAPPSLAGSSDLPGGFGRAVQLTSPDGFPCRTTNASLFGLAPCGVLPATHVATGAVRSYRTFSPLPSSAQPAPCGPASARVEAVYFLCHFPSGCPDRALPGALPCGVRTFLLALALAPLRRCPVGATIVWPACGGGDRLAPAAAIIRPFPA